MEIDFKSLGMRIRKLRESAKPKISREKMAEEVGVSPVSVYRWENAEAEIDLRHTVKLATFLKVSIDELLGRPSRSDLLVRIFTALPRLNEDQVRALLTLVEGYLSGSASLGDVDSNVNLANKNKRSK